MNDSELTTRLSTLLEMDRDAVKLYDEAARVMGTPDLGIDATRTRNQHEAHAMRIEKTIRDRGQQPRNATAQFVSIMELHLSSISRARDADETMITLRMAERIMNLEYAELLQMEMPEDLRSMLTENLADEQRHLEAVESWLEQNVGAEVGVYL